MKYLILILMLTLPLAAQELLIRELDGGVKEYLVDGVVVTEEVFDQAVALRDDNALIEAKIQEEIRRLAVVSLIARDDGDKGKLEDELARLPGDRP